MNYFRRAHSKEVTIFHRRLLFLTKWLSVIYLTIFLFISYQVLIFFSFHKSFAYLAFYIPILTKFYIYAHCHKTYPPYLKAQTLTFLYTCPLTGFFWLLSHMIYLKLTKVSYECLLSQS